MKGKLQWLLRQHGCEILFDDACMLALNKPAGVLVLPDRFDASIPNLYRILTEELGRVYVVHRIDKETSGVILFARTPDAHRDINGQFEQREVEKVYYLIVLGNPTAEEAIVTVPLRETAGVVHEDRKKGKEALTEFRVLTQFDGFAFVEARPQTGRMHQIRVHVRSLGVAILGDGRYGGGSGFYLSQVKENYRVSGEEKPLLSRAALHASSLRLRHPETGTVVRIEAPLPKDMRSVLRYLEKFRKK
jgi:RluA family pseudouridine synthase